VQVEPVQGLLEDMRYEVIPMKGVDDQVRCLSPGAVVTVTCSPRHGIERSVAMATQYRHLGYRAVPHVAARLVRDRVHLQAVAQSLEEAGLKEVFVIAGDEAQPAGSFVGALDVLRGLHEIDPSGWRIGVASYPDGHPMLSAAQLMEALAAKQPYAAYMVTQLCFDAEKIASWLAEVRERGIGLPVYIGIPGWVDRRRLWEIALRIGVGESTRYLRRNTHVAQELLAHDRYDPAPLIEAVLEAVERRGLAVAGFHVNTFNQVCATVEWKQRWLAELNAAKG
jgi:methylenetetrahydrofolate reductase (NADPH)